MKKSWCHVTANYFFHPDKEGVFDVKCDGIHNHRIENILVENIVMDDIKKQLQEKGFAKISW